MCDVIYMYEGCPSKSWTFVIKRDFCIRNSMIFLRCVHIHLGNILYKYGWNHVLENKVICIYMTGGLCIRRTSKFL